MKFANLFASLRARMARVIAAGIAAAVMLFAFVPPAPAQGKPVLTITPNAGQQKFYRFREPSDGFTFTVAGWTGGDDPSDELTGKNKQKKVLVRESGQNVGTYAYLLHNNAKTNLLKNAAAREKYDIALATTDRVFTIRPRTVWYVTRNARKVYDGTDAGPVDLGGNWREGSGPHGNDDASVTGGRYTAGPAVGQNKTIVDAQLIGEDAGNYMLRFDGGIGGGGTLPAIGNITPRPLTLSNVVLSKAADGGTEIAGARVTADIGNVVAGQSVILGVKSDATGAFSQAAVGTGLTVTGLDGDELEILSVTGGHGPESYSVPSGALAATGSIAVAVQQDDADITSLTLEDSEGNTITPSPAFDAATTTYTATITGGNVKFTAVFVGSKIVVGGNNANTPASGIQSANARNQDLRPGQAEPVTLVVTAQDGSTTKTYTFQITRAAVPPVAAPANPAVAVGTAAGSLNVTWEPVPSGNFGGAEISAYQVRWGEDEATVAWNANGDGVNAGDGDARAYTITGLDAGTTYQVQVAGVNSAGTGEWSNSVIGVPEAAQNDATISEITVTDSAGDAVTISPSFDPATDAYTGSIPTIATGVKFNAVFAGSGVVVNGEIGNTPASGADSSLVTIAVAGSEAIELVVTAKDGSTTKTYTFTITRPAGAPIVAPANPTAVVGAAAGSLTFTWDGVAAAGNGGSAITGYQVRWGQDARDVAWNEGGDGVLAGGGADARSYTITGLEVGTLYQMQVAAVNTNGIGVWSASATGTPEAVSDNADITVLAANGADGVTTFVLTPEFSAMTTSYAAMVANEVEGVIFTATFAGTKLVIGGDADNSPASGAAGDVVSLSPGVAKDITLVVTAADGSTTKTYTVTVTRAAGVPRKPGAPGLGIGEFTSNPGDINIRWNWAGGADNNGAAHTGYRYQWRAKGASAWEPDAMGTWVAQTGAISRSINISGLQVGTLYQVRWRIVNSVGDGPWSDVAESRTSGPPRATATFDAVPGHGKISISNIANSGSDFGGGTIPAPGFTRTLALAGRDIRWRTSRRGGNPPGDWQNAAGASDEGQDIVLAASYEITGLNGNRSYDVQMRLYNKFSGADGKGDWSRTQKVTPTKTALTITPLAASKVYGAADPALTYTIAGAVDGDGNSEVFSASPINRGAGENAGEYDFSLKSSIPWAATGNPRGKYTLVTALDGDAKFTINQKEVTYTSTGADKVYDSKQDAPAALGGSFAAGDIVVASGLGINDTGKLLVTGGRYGDKNVGTAKTVTQFVLDGDSKDNYSLASGSSVAGDISKLATTLTLSADARVYDGSSDIAAVRTAFSPAIFSGDTVTVDTSGAAYGDANVGASKTITGVADAQISGADKGNYEITITGTGEVTQRPLRVTASSTGTARPDTTALGDRSLLTIQSGTANEGLVSPDTAATVLSGPIALGVESVSAPFTSALTQGNLVATGNYQLIWTDGVFTRTALPVLTVTPEHTTRVFGGTDPTFTVTVALTSGAFLTGDNVNNIFTSGAAVLQRATGDDVGVYAFSLVDPLPLQDSGDSARYTIVVAAGADYRITPKELSATAIVVEKAYDATNAITGATLSGGVLSGLEGSDAATLAIQSGSDAVYATTDVATGITMTTWTAPTLKFPRTPAARPTTRCRPRFPSPARSPRRKSRWPRSR